MFLQREDYYFLAYNILIILNELNCVEGKRTFRDHRKLSFIIEFTSKGSLVEILQRGQSNGSINLSDRDRLSRSYSVGLTRMNEVLRITLFLAHNGILTATKQRDGTFNLRLNPEKLPSGFLRSEEFAYEISNIQSFRRQTNRLSNLLARTFLERTYSDNGIMIWEDY